ncbi:unnamed protein product [Effrenium voratum]|nr:unnamed protein product [Effrenium voratum]
MGKAAKGGKKLPSAPLADKKKKAKKNPLFEKAPRSYRLGGDIQPKRDLTRFVKWPKYINLQRQKRIMLMRLKVPPAINQFSMTIDKNQAANVLKLCKKYMPETKVAKKARLMEMAQQKKDGQEVKTKKPQVLKYGLNHVTTLVENKMAKLVIIAHDVEPIELVCWLPALCRKKDVPYCIIKGKSRLGQLIHQKTCACVAITSVKPEDEKELNNLVGNFKAQFNDNVEVKRRWGGGIMGIKSQHVTQRRERAIQAEKAKKLGLSEGNELSRRELERQIQELRRDKVQLDASIRKMEAAQKRIFGEEEQRKLTALHSQGEENGDKENGDKEEEKKEEGENEESRKRKRDEEFEKRKKEGKPTKSDPRSRNLFGKLLGHLHSAKDRLQKEKTSKMGELQQKALSRVEEKVNLSKMNIKEFRKGHFEKQLVEEQAKVAEIEKQLEEKEVLLLQRRLENHYSIMMNFIRTEVHPPIFFLPSKHTRDTEKQLEATRASIKTKIAELRQKFKEEAQRSSKRENGKAEAEGEAEAEAEGEEKEKGKEKDKEKGEMDVEEHRR